MRDSTTPRRGSSEHIGCYTETLIYNASPCLVSFSVCIGSWSRERAKYVGRSHSIPGDTGRLLRVLHRQVRKMYDICAGDKGREAVTSLALALDEIALLLCVARSAIWDYSICCCVTSFRAPARSFEVIAFPRREVSDKGALFSAVILGLRGSIYLDEGSWRVGVLSAFGV